MKSFKDYIDLKEAEKKKAKKREHNQKIIDEILKTHKPLFDRLKNK